MPKHPMPTMVGKKQEQEPQIGMADIRLRSRSRHGPTSSLQATGWKWTRTIWFRARSNHPPKGSWLSISKMHSCSSPSNIPWQRGSGVVSPWSSWCSASNESQRPYAKRPQSLWFATAVLFQLGQQTVHRNWQGNASRSKKLRLQSYA